MSAAVPRRRARQTPKARRVRGAAWLSGWFAHGLLLAATAGVFSWPAAGWAGALSAGLCALFGAYLAERWTTARYRLLVILLGAAGLAGLGVLLSGWGASSLTLAGLLGTQASLLGLDLLWWGSLSLGAVLALRALAIRSRAALALEGAAAVLAVASLVAAHRDGMIARPLFISDWFWSQGLDPLVAFLGVGLAAVVLLAFLLMRGRKQARAWAQLLLVLLLGGLIAGRLAAPDPDSARQAQREGGDKEREGQRGGEARRGQGGGAGEAGEGEGAEAQEPPDSDLPSAGQSEQQNPAAVVVFADDVQPGGGIYYFRQSSFSQFNGRRLVRTTEPGIDPDAGYRWPAAVQTLPGPGPKTKGRAVVDTEVALMLPHKRVFGLTDALQFSPRRNPDPTRFPGGAYGVRSSVVVDSLDKFIGHQPGEAGWSDSVWENYTELPHDDRYHRLAAKLRGELKAEYASDPIAMAIVVKRYLEKSSIYSLKVRYEGEEPTAAFLFSEEQRGYCVHLSHAAVYLMRAMGLPARVSVGYAVEAARRGKSSSLLIEKKDAHAWAELYLNGVGWLPIEVTPEQVEDPPEPFAAKDLQQLLGEMARKPPAPEADAEPPVLKEWLARLRAALPYLALALILLAYGVKLWRLYRPGQADDPRLAYRAGLDRAAELGFVRGYGVSRERFAGGLLSQSPSFYALTEVHTAAFFGSDRPERAAGGESYRQLAAQAGEELSRARPAWRRWLGRLNPLSWLLSR